MLKKFSLIRRSSSEKLAIAIISIIYLVGIVGLSIPLHEDFVLLTPLNLLLSTGLVLYFHTHWQKKQIAGMLLVFMAGWTAEYVGVNTGLLFGNYTYGPVLGPQIGHTPLMIGVNWLLLSYAVASLLVWLKLSTNCLLNTLLGALVLTGIDILIEPVAMDLDFWQWEGDTVPLQNYIGWFVVALPIMFCQFFFGLAQKNKVALALLLLQVLFFTVLQLTLGTP